MRHQAQHRIQAQVHPFHHDGLQAETAFSGRCSGALPMYGGVTPEVLVVLSI